MKVLVVGPSWIGDTVISHSVYIALRKRYVEVEIDVITSSYCKPLVSRMSEVNNIFIKPNDSGSLLLSQHYRLGKYLYKNGYQQAIVLPNSFKSALIPFFAHIPKRTGWIGEMRYCLINDIRADNKTLSLMVHKYLALVFDYKTFKDDLYLVQEDYFPKLVIEECEINSVLKIFQINKISTLIGLCPGSAFSSMKCWPYYHYATLLLELIHSNYQVILLGSKKDKFVGDIISSLIPKTLWSYYNNLIGFTTMDQAIALIASCDIIVSNDSGLMHVASALNRPLIALYGPTDPKFTPPLSNKSHVIRLVRNADRINRDCNLYKYHQSLIDIKPLQVLQKVKELLIY